MGLLWPDGQSTMRSAKKESGSEASGRRSLPAVTALLARSTIAELIALHGRAVVLEAIRACLEDARDALADRADPHDDAALDRAIAARAERLGRGTLRPVLN